MSNTRIFKTSFASVYPFYLQKAEKKGGTRTEVDLLICWLTGYTEENLQQQIDNGCDFETFFGQAPRMNPDRSKIRGVYHVNFPEDSMLTFQILTNK